MWCNGFAVQGRALLGGGGDGSGQEMLDSVAAEWSAAVGGKQRIGGVGVPFGEPGPQDLDGLAGQRDDAVLAALAGAAQVGWSGELEVGCGELGEFGDA